MKIEKYYNNLGKFQIAWFILTIAGTASGFIYLLNHKDTWINAILAGLFCVFSVWTNYFFPRIYSTLFKPPQL